MYTSHEILQLVNQIKSIDFSTSAPIRFMKLLRQDLMKNAGLDVMQIEKIISNMVVELPADMEDEMVEELALAYSDIIQKLYSSLINDVGFMYPEIAMINYARSLVLKFN